MKIKRLRAENFRNIEKCDIALSDGVTLLVGNNAEGKTNAIEGIYLFARGRSHRTSDDTDMVRFGTEGFRLGIEYEGRDGEGTLEYAVFGKERLRKKNGYKISRVGEMLGSFKAVLFYPDNLEIVKDGPEERRSFLNVAISQVYPSYLGAYSKYKQSLEARNKLLKLSREHYISPEEIGAWSYSMAEYASYIYIMRVEYLNLLSAHVLRVGRELSGGREDITLEYKSDIDVGALRRLECRAVGEAVSDIERESVRDAYLDILTRELQRELAAGTTLFGIQRDDVLIKINGVAARSFASQGQKRSVVLALKLAEGEVIRELFGEYPVFLFDDVLSELDEGRRKYIVGGMGERQVIITSCEADELLPYADLIYEVKEGSYVPSHR